MPDFEGLVTTTYRTFREMFADNRQVLAPSISLDYLDTRLLFPETILDEESFNDAELRELWKALSRHAVTQSGYLAIFAALAQPSTSLELITAKQSALKEIESNDGLRKSIADYLQNVKEFEHEFQDFLLGKVKLKDGEYEKFRAAMKHGKNIVALNSIPQPESLYLEYLLGNIREFDGTSNQRLMRGPIYRRWYHLDLEQNLGSKEDTPWAIRRIPLLIRFRPYEGAAMLKTLFFSLAGYNIGYFANENNVKIASKIASNNPTLFIPLIGHFISLAMLGIMAFSSEFFKKELDDWSVNEPLRARLSRDSLLKQAFDSYGRLDELMAYHSFMQSMKQRGVDMVMPTLTEADSHYFVAGNMRTPLLCAQDAQESSGRMTNVVPNEVYLRDGRLTILTGPNSSGKTVLAKGVMQNQVLAQAGSYVTAESAEIGICDRAFYVYYVPDKTQRGEGDFGANLQRVKGMFIQATPRSLAILNSIASGTTYEEETNHSYNILLGFNETDCTTIYVTHNHSLAERLQREGIGNFWQTTIKDGVYTYKIEPGIASTSGADLVAKRVGFATRDIAEILKEKIDSGVIK